MRSGDFLLIKLSIYVSQGTQRQAMSPGSFTAIQDEQMPSIRSTHWLQRPLRVAIPSLDSRR